MTNEVKIDEHLGAAVKKQKTENAVISSPDTQVQPNSIEKKNLMIPKSQEKNIESVPNQAQTTPLSQDSWGGGTGMQQVTVKQGKEETSAKMIANNTVASISAGELQPVGKVENQKVQ